MVLRFCVLCSRHLAPKDAKVCAPNLTSSNVAPGSDAKYAIVNQHKKKKEKEQNRLFLNIADDSQNEADESQNEGDASCHQ